MTTPFILSRQLSLSLPLTKRKILALQIHVLYQTIVSQDAQMEKITKVRVYPQSTFKTSGLDGDSLLYGLYQGLFYVTCVIRTC